jgi:hypothetical protein
MRRVTAVTVIDGFRLDLTFDDGIRGTVDLSDLAGGKNMLGVVPWHR